MSISHHFKTTVYIFLDIDIILFRWFWTRFLVNNTVGRLVPSSLYPMRLRKRHCTCIYRSISSCVVKTLTTLKIFEMFRLGRWYQAIDLDAAWLTSWLIFELGRIQKSCKKMKNCCKISFFDPPPNIHGGNGLPQNWFVWFVKWCKHHPAFKKKKRIMMGLIFFLVIHRMLFYNDGCSSFPARKET